MLRNMTAVALTALSILAGCGSGPGKPVERLGGTYDMSGFALRSLKALATATTCRYRLCLDKPLRHCSYGSNSTSPRPRGSHRQRGAVLAVKAQYGNGQ